VAPSAEGGVAMLAAVCPWRLLASVFGSNWATTPPAYYISAGDTSWPSRIGGRLRKPTSTEPDSHANPTLGEEPGPILILAPQTPHFFHIDGANPNSLFKKSNQNSFFLETEYKYEHGRLQTYTHSLL